MGRWEVDGRVAACISVPSRRLVSRRAELFSLSLSFCLSKKNKIRIEDRRTGRRQKRGLCRPAVISGAGPLSLSLSRCHAMVYTHIR